MSTPPLVMNRTWRRPRHMAVASEAAISTARSNDSPWWVDGRVSRRMVERDSQGISSWRSISSPVRAVERQWTRRRSSPTSYSRRPKKSRPTGTRDACIDPIRASRLAAPGRGRTSSTLG